ncbi:Asp23/Gls24 family envelope stress response protein [Wenjunlia tyrosinilytica]|uniref:Asp23/Gls24 family envelope stress response protein n=1 Tax=Wenjunlia tyrosinilytica TaxID=1544741 RepID=A0A917ZFN8_9ACTN|nr:Asp23/Gls24 family envelope stress response protein [Wenjunlia tyrosinilytica]GGO81229.1 hypothetical protein GCM10012280_04940 [Wenjunlia tyrosinilytica]
MSAPRTDTRALVRIPPAERGATRIADRVVAKVASRTAREVLSAAAERHRALAALAAGASVTVRSGVARIRLTVELAYPVDIAAICATLRHEVATRVHTLTGMDVPQVVVQVERLHPAVEAEERAGRVR